jgi:hypothetical protein
MEKDSVKAEREARLAKALRANLARRKAQARARQAGPADAGVNRAPDPPRPDAQKPHEPGG